MSTTPSKKNKGGFLSNIFLLHHVKPLEPLVSSIHMFIFFCFRFRNISITSHCVGKPPRVYPVTHQVLNDYNAKYFTQFPELTKEDLEGKLAKFAGEKCKVLIDVSVDLDIWWSSWKFNLVTDYTFIFLKNSIVFFFFTLPRTIVKKDYTILRINCCDNMIYWVEYF